MGPAFRGRRPDIRHAVRRERADEVPRESPLRRRRHVLDQVEAVSRLECARDRHFWDIAHSELDGPFAAELHLPVLDEQRFEIRRHDPDTASDRATKLMMYSGLSASKKTERRLVVPNQIEIAEGRSTQIPHLPVTQEEIGLCLSTANRRHPARRIVTQQIDRILPRKKAFLPR
jgi:hypothetical protein